MNENEALEETAEILADDEALSAIRRGLDDRANERVLPLEEVRKELAGRDRR